MQSVSELLPITPSIDQLARIIGNVAAPAFLLGAVASFISVLLSRINRVIDRAQFIHGIPEGDTRRTSEPVPVLRDPVRDPHRPHHHRRLHQRDPADCA